MERRELEQRLMAAERRVAQLEAHAAGQLWQHGVRGWGAAGEPAALELRRGGRLMHEVGLDPEDPDKVVRATGSALECIRRALDGLEFRGAREEVLSLVAACRSVLAYAEERLELQNL
jgi:hypothetical protein